MPFKSWINIEINIGNKRKEKGKRKHKINGNRNTQAGGNIENGISLETAKDLLRIYGEALNEVQTQANFESLALYLKFISNYGNQMSEKGRPLEDYRPPSNERERYIFPWNQAIKNWQRANGITLADIGEILGLSENTIKKKSSNYGYDYTLLDISKLLEYSAKTEIPLKIPFVGEMIEAREKAMKEILKRALIEKSISEFPAAN